MECGVTSGVEDLQQSAADELAAVKCAQGRISQRAGFYEEHLDAPAGPPLVTDGERRMTSFIIVCKS